MCAVADDRSAVARIRDAAVQSIADVGVAATTVRRVAASAGVSPGLVIHHFGSMAALRRACDRHVAAVLRERKLAVLARDGALDPLQVMLDQDDGVPLQAYLARSLTEASPEVDALVDELVADAERYLREGAERGMLRNVPDPHAVGTVLAVWSLGALVLHRHVRRLIGVDLTGPAAGHAEEPRYVHAGLALLSEGIVLPHVFAGGRVDASGGGGVTPTTEARPEPSAREGGDE